MISAGMVVPVGKDREILKFSTFCDVVNKDRTGKA